jgi:hypothetical protein
MSLKASKSKNSIILLVIIVVSVVTIALLSASYFSQSNGRLNTVAIINQTPKPSSPLESLAGINETSGLNVTGPFYNNNSTIVKTNTTPSVTLTSTTYEVQYVPRIFSPPNSHQDQIGQSDLATLTNEANTNETSTLNAGNPSNNTSPPLNLIPILLNESDFVTYTYGGCLVQQANSTQFIFSFPNCTNQGQLSGSDALTWNNFSIQKLDFDVTFIVPNINAFGFDEMAIFATSNTKTYKGTEFGVRMDLQNGSIYGYIQEYNESVADVNFNMLQLMPNDGLTHHYTLNMKGSEVSFYIDGINSGVLNFPSNTDYSNLNFSICAVVHRFTDGWDSTGDSMISGNFSLNHQ